MLGLKLPTDPRWVNVAQMNIGDILTDHAYCEQKAATSCITIIVQNPEREKVVETLAPIVTEEWGHFRMVLKELAKRNFKLGRQRKDEYVGELLQLERKSVPREVRLLDKLLINAIIEARSCERFRILSENIEDDGLKKFYHELMISEAGHYRTFVDLAKEYHPADVVKTRLDEMLKEEARIIENLEIRGDRIH